MPPACPTHETTWADFGAAVRRAMTGSALREKQAARERRETVLPALRQALESLRRQETLGELHLFGSYAWGEPHARSDLDLLVERPEDEARVFLAISRRLDLPLHLVVGTHAPEGLVERARTFGIAL